MKLLRDGNGYFTLGGVRLHGGEFVRAVDETNGGTKTFEVLEYLPNTSVLPLALVDNRVAYSSKVGSELELL